MATRWSVRLVLIVNAERNVLELSVEADTLVSALALGADEMPRLLTDTHLARFLGKQVVLPAAGQIVTINSLADLAGAVRKNITAEEKPLHVLAVYP